MSFDRKLGAEVVIMLAVAVGAWFILVEPRMRELSELQSEKARVVADAGLVGTEEIGAMSKQLGAVRARVREIEHRSRFGVDPSDLYGLVMALGEQHALDVQRILPSPKPNTLDEEAAPVSTLSAEVHVRGDFVNMAAFLNALSESEPYVRPVSITLLPFGDIEDPELDCRFAFEMLHFTPDAPLVKLLEGSDP